jgi:hypothetical protein
MCELVSANDNGDEAGDLGNRSGKQVLHGGEAVSKGEPPAACACAAIGMSRKSRKAVFETGETRMCLRHAGERFIGTSGFVNLTPIERSCRRDWRAIFLLSKIFFD